MDRAIPNRVQSLFCTDIIKNSITNNIAQEEIISNGVDKWVGDWYNKLKLEGLNFEFQKGKDDEKRFCFDDFGYYFVCFGFLVSRLQLCPAW